MTFRRTKIAGLIGIAASAAALMVVGDYATRSEWLAKADRSQLLWAAVAWFVAANVFALGFILLLAGLREVPLGRGSRARRGVLVKMAGANLIILCFAYVALEEAVPNWPLWLVAITLVAFVVAARFGIMLLRTGWKYEALPASEAMARDPRPPVIYLRSFHEDDDVLIFAGGRVWNSLRPLLAFVPPFYFVAASPEQELAAILQRIGPVVAIGKPGERLPELGAARMYVSDDTWRATVDDLLKKAAIVLIRAGTTPNLWWEIDEAMKLVPRQRVVIVELPDTGGNKEFDRKFAERFGEPTTIDPPPPATWKKFLAPFISSQWRGGRVLYFDASNRPRAVPIRFTLELATLMTGLGRPYHASFLAAIRQVFTSQGRPWRTSRNQILAVMLGLFGGPFGLHLFYLGDRRGGWRRLLLFWAIFPIVLGVRDGVRLALLDRRMFMEKYGEPPD